MKVFLLLIMFFSGPVETPDSVRVIEYCDLSYNFILENQDSAIYYGKKAITLAQDIQFDRGLAQAYNDLGFVYYYRSEYDSALLLWQSALDIRKTLKDTLGIAALYNKIGALQYQKGEFEASLKSQFAALEIFEKAGNKAGVAKSYNNIASVYQHQDLLDQALVYFQKAIEIKKEIEDYYETAGTILNVAGIYLSKQKIELAKSTFIEAIEILDSRGFAQSIYSGSAHNDLSILFLNPQTENLDSALIHAGLALKIRKELGDQEGVISSSNQLGFISLKKGDLKNAENILLETAQLAKEKGLKSQLRASYQYLSDVYRQKGKYQAALEYSDLYHATKDSLLNEHTQSTIAELQTKYETEKKEQQIALQQAEIAEQQAQNKLNYTFITGLCALVIFLLVIGLLMRSRARKKEALLMQEAAVKLREMQIEAAISSQEKERSRFARDLHDGFGQMISILNLNLKSLENENADRHLAFEQSTKVLDEMYQELKGICFNLMPQTLIKSGVAAAIAEFASRVNQTDKIYVETDFFGMDQRLTEVQEISLYRITQEWINNILKYSDATKVTVQITKDEDELTLLIEDDGLGFDLEKMKNGKGNGWHNMNSRANLMKGELEVDTQPGVRGNSLILNAKILELYPVAAA